MSTEPRPQDVAHSAPAQPEGEVDPGSLILEMRNISKEFPGVKALSDVSMTVRRGEVAAILGPSGGGKSTLLRCINGLESFQQGRVSIDSLALEPTTSQSAPTLLQLRRRVGMVFQRPNPFPKSIYDNVAYGPALNALCSRRDLPDQVEQCLRRAALWDEVRDRLDSPATGLSGGQQQRLCIARALGNQPTVLLMDEPCSALDPIATQKIEELIFELKRDYTIVIVTHNMQQAARVSDFTGFFDRGGVLVELGGTNQIFTNPKHERTEAYITGRFG